MTYGRHHYRTPADNMLRARVWRGLILGCIIAWVGIVAWIITPAARAIVDAASARPAVCAQYDPSDCAAAVTEGR